MRASAFNRIPPGESLGRRQKSVPTGPRIAATACALILASCGNPEPTPTGSSDVRERVAQVLKVEDDIERIHAFTGLLQELPGEAAPEVAEGFEGAFVDRGDIELVLLAQWWTPHDLEAVQMWAISSWRAEHPRIEYAVMRAAARQSPRDAVALYYRSSRDPRTYLAVLEALIVGWYESGSPGLLDFIDQQPSTEVRQQAVGTLARIRVLDAGAEAATSWAEQLAVQRNGDNLSQLVISRVANAAGEHDPAVAGKWAKRIIGEGASTRLLPRVAGRWSKRDPLGALEWLSQFEENGDQRFAVRKSFTNFRMIDTAGADAWLAAQGDAAYGWLGPALEYQLKTVTDRSYANENRRALIDWEGMLASAIRIEDEPRRWATVTHITRLWLLEDTPAAEAWMQANDVPQLYRDKAHGPLPTGYMKKLERLAGP